VGASNGKPGQAAVERGTHSGTKTGRAVSFPPEPRNLGGGCELC